MGVNTAGRNEAQNMNYAIPIEEVCKIVELLQTNIDPTPPEIPFSFFKDTDNKNTLKIAKILKAGERFNAKVGDSIVAAGIHHVKVSNEPQLLNILRGQISQAKLYVARDGKEIKLEAPLKSLPTVDSKTAVYFSGIVIREERNPEILDLFGPEDKIRIEYVEGGSLGDSRGITCSDILLSINGIPVSDINQVYQLLSDLRAQGSVVSLRLKRLSFEQNHFFTYRDRTVPLENLSWLAPDFGNSPGQAKQTLAGVR